MKIILRSMLFQSLVISAPLCHSAELAPDQVSTALKRSADWQLANPSGTEIRDWIIVPLDDGLLRTALATGDAKYLAAVIRTHRLPATAMDGKNEHALAIVRLDDQGRVSFRSGFAWAGDGEITTEQAWLDYLKSKSFR